MSAKLAAHSNDNISNSCSIIDPTEKRMDPGDHGYYTYQEFVTLIL